MGAYDQSTDASESHGERGGEQMGGKRRRGMPMPAEDGRMTASKSGMPQERRERGSRGGSPSGRPSGRSSGSEFDESSQRRAQQRMRDAEDGRDEGDWA